MLLSDFEMAMRFLVHDMADHRCRCPADQTWAISSDESYSLYSLSLEALHLLKRVSTCSWMEPSAHTATRERISATCILNQICLPTSLWRSWIRRLLRRKRHLSWVRHHTHIAVLAWVLPCFCMISKWRCDSWYMIWPQVPRSKTATIAPEDSSSDESYSFYSLSLEAPHLCFYVLLDQSVSTQFHSFTQMRVHYRLQLAHTSEATI